MTQGERQRVVIGTYTHHDGASRDEGIFVFALDPASGRLEVEAIFSGVVNPSYLALAGDVLYAVIEEEEFAGVPGGGLSALRLTEPPLRAALINAQPTHDSWPCHLTVSPSGRWVLVANYGSGLTVLPIRADGGLGEAACIVRQQGRSVHPERQDAPHAHSITFDPSGRWVIAADLGLDRLLIYRLDEATGQLVPNDPPWAEAEPGAGPRHVVFHPDGRWLYAINELTSTVTSYAFDAARGTLTPAHSAAILPDDFTAESTAAAIRLAPSGRFLYASNRGYDGIAVFALDAETGGLTRLALTPTGGKTPRDFALDPSGRCLVAANQNSDSLVTFHVDAATGLLTLTGVQIEIPRPVAVLMA
ncbi:MAG: lactonase family protein [Anaerolineae bacterium]|nr:lactonase family protein [Anaerolineae bacterium]NUQ06657.1 lactonase family protein [Anaerolineae bacterium]